MDYRSAKTFAFFLIALTCGDVSTRSQLENHDARKIANYSNKFTFKRELPSSSTRQTERIAGGSFANEGQFPFMAVVHRLIYGRRVTQCGGTIISERWVLTAGHCVVRRPRRFFVIFGIVDKTGIGYDFNNGPGVAMMTTRAFVHPNYFFARNDIGLLRMPRDIPFSDTIQPIRLAREINIEPDIPAYVVGWGRDGTGVAGVRRLRYAIMPLLSRRECAAYWRVDLRNICTVPGLGRNACQGDSGGPLFIMRNNNEPLQIGIVSYGDAYCPSYRPGVYTRVAAFGRWIEYITGTIL